MRFGRLHRVFIDALAALGLLSLLTGGQLPVAFSVGCGAGMVLAMLVPERHQHQPWLRLFGMLASLSLLAAQTVRLLSGAQPLTVAVEFAAALQVVRVATRRGAAHDQQIVLLALLHLVAGTVLGGGLAYGLSFAGFLLVAPGALVLSHLRREVEGNYRQGARDRTGLPVDVPRILRSRRVVSRNFVLLTSSLSIPVFLFTALLFVLFPRVGLSFLMLNNPNATRMVGFSSRVDLGGVGRLRSDPTIAMRVQLVPLPASPEPRLAFYLRGTVFDRYVDGSWLRTRPQRRPLHGSGIHWLAGPQNVAPALTVELQPIDPPILFLPADASGFAIKRGAGAAPFLTAVTVADGEEYQYNGGGDRGIQYTVYRGRRPKQPLSAGDRARHLEVPAEISAPLAALAREWTEHAASEEAQVATIAQRLRSDFRYDLNSPSGSAPQPLLHFLFESRAGHCEYYSTAMALLLRTLGVPTRNVTGFIGGSYNRFGSFYAVRQGDAHSWVEVYLDSRGWTRFDPTPPASVEGGVQEGGLLAFTRELVEAAAQRWSRHVVGYDLDQQLSLLRSAQRRYGRLGGVGRFAKGRTLYWAIPGLVALALLAYRFRGRLRRGLAASRRSPRQPKPSERAIRLYQYLDTSLAHIGVARPVARAPLAHARQLCAQSHPAGPEVLALTELYLQARFGGHPLSGEAERLFSDRVQALRSAARERKA